MTRPTIEETAAAIAREHARNLAEAERAQKMRRFIWCVVAAAMTALAIVLAIRP